VEEERKSRGFIFIVPGLMGLKGGELGIQSLEHPPPLLGVLEQGLDDKARVVDVSIGCHDIQKGLVVQHFEDKVDLGIMKVLEQAS
jgi:hypothetical protein